MVNFKNLAIAATTLFGLTLGAPVTQGESGKVVPGSYIVTLKPDAKGSELTSHLKWVDDVHKRSLSKRDTDNGVERTYDGKYGFKGYAGTFDKETIQEIKDNPLVRSPIFHTLVT